MHPEAVLLVDDGEGEVSEPHPLLDERVGADHQVDGPVGDRREDALARLPGDRARERRERDGLGRGFSLLLRRHGAEQALLPFDRAAARSVRLLHARELAAADGLEEGAHRPQMLAGEHLSGRHDRRLVSGLHRDQGAVERDHGLARAHLTLHEAVHRPRAPHVLRELLHRSSLRAGRLERQRAEERLGQVAVDAMGRSRRATLQASLPERHPQLEREQLVELHAIRRPRERLRRLREVDGVDRVVLRDESLSLDDLVRQRVGDRPEPRERSVHELADRS